MDKSSISIRELSERTGIPQTTLYRKLRGQADFYVGEVASIAEALSVEPRELLPPELRSTDEAAA